MMHQRPVKGFWVIVRLRMVQLPRFRVFRPLDRLPARKHYLQLVNGHNRRGGMQDGMAIWADGA